MSDPLTARSRHQHNRQRNGGVLPRRERSPAARFVRRLLLLGCVAGVAAVVAVGALLSQAGRTPREWAPYVQRRGSGHNPLIVNATAFAAAWLTRADRLFPAAPAVLPAALGASADRSGLAPAGRVRTVASFRQLADAIAAAEPGDVIEIAAGHYRTEGWYAVNFTRAGTAAAPITLRAARLGDVVIESNLVETFKIRAPFWRIENLVMRGACPSPGDCEHALHIVGAATDTVIRNNRFEDYNAQIKINGEGGRWPDRGVIEGNSFIDTAPRDTQHPITPIDLVGASQWRISGNVIADFVRAGGGAPTYGAFVKGAGSGNIMERNLVVCEHKLTGQPGQRVGLSLGGGGTDPASRRDGGRTGIEQIGGVIRDNLIVGCSDVGIYLNRAAGSLVDHNTLLDTAGIEARFAETSARVTANIVDGAIRGRDGAVLQDRDNAAPWLVELFLGLHPQRGFYRGPAELDLRWRREPALLPDSDRRIDLCGRRRGDLARPGAFEDYADCSRPGPNSPA